MMKDVLDRTIGRAPEVIDVASNPSEQLAELLAILEEPMHASEEPARKLPAPRHLS
jgi:hypothetical protein